MPGLAVGDAIAGLGAGEVLEREAIFKPGILTSPSSALSLKMAVVAVSFRDNLTGPFLRVAGVGGVIVVAVVGVATGGPGVKVEELFGPSVCESGRQPWKRAVRVRQADDLPRESGESVIAPPSAVLIGGGASPLAVLGVGECRAGEEEVRIDNELAAIFHRVVFAGILCEVYTTRLREGVVVVLCSSCHAAYK